MKKSLMIFRQNLDVSNIVWDSFYLELCHFWKLTEFLVLPSSRFHANTKVSSYGEMNVYLFRLFNIFDYNFKQYIFETFDIFGT